MCRRYGLFLPLIAVPAADPAPLLLPAAAADPTFTVIATHHEILRLRLDPGGLGSAQDDSEEVGDFTPLRLRVSAVNMDDRARARRRDPAPSFGLRRDRRARRRVDGQQLLTPHS